MAPTPSLLQLTTTLNTMSSPNTNDFPLLVREKAIPGIYVIYVGKETQPVSLTDMASVNSYSWGKRHVLTHFSTTSMVY